MNGKSAYFEQVDLLLNILPFVSKIRDFALKGGSAINLFVRNFPRLSVDIDLTYLPLQDRETTIKQVDKDLRRIGQECQKYLPATKLFFKVRQKYAYGLIISRNQTVVKIEPNLIIRGSVFPPVDLKLTKKVEDMFGKTMEARTLSVEDLYGGKLCAALDRQHPRDLFDVHHLFINDGITDSIRQAFIVYLLSHGRPMAELLNPQLKADLSETFCESFEGMAFDPVTLDDMVESWKAVVWRLNEDFTENERKFILSFKQKKPEWELFPFSHIKDLPAVRWKMINLEKMSDEMHKRACEKLQRILYG